jgi:predicted HicB family RNase H-like nuclease
MSKQISLRLSDELHAQINEAAHNDRRSMNSWITVILERALAERDTASKRLTKAG